MEEASVMFADTGVCAMPVFTLADGPAYLRLLARGTIPTAYGAAQPSAGFLPVYGRGNRHLLVSRGGAATLVVERISPIDHMVSGGPFGWRRRVE